MRNFLILVVSSIFLIPSLSFAAIEISDGSVKLLYHLDSDSVDASGNANNGTDTSISYVAGKLGSGAASLSSTSNSRIIFNSLPVTGAPVTMSMSFWYKTGTSARQGIVAMGDWTITNDDQQLYIYTDYKLHWDANAVGGPNTSFTTVDDVWRHVVITINSGTGTLYVDGVSIGSFGSGNLRISSGGTSVKGIGCDGTCNNAVDFDGEIDEVVIFNTVISTSTISSLYNGGTGNTVCVTSGCASSGGGSSSSTDVFCDSDLCQNNMEHLYLWLITGIFALGGFIGYKLLYKKL